MENQDNPKELMEAKSKLKKEKISILRQVNKQLADLQKELDEAMPKDQQARSQNPARLQERVDKMEFYISTSAYTPAQEREMLRQVQEMRKELKKALADDKTWGKVREIRSKLRDARNQRKEIRKELDGLTAELDTLYKAIIAQGAKTAEKRRENEQKRTEFRERSYRREEYRKNQDAQRKEMAPYMKEVDSFVSLEDIAIVNKKEKKA